jgi:hypothetical protein
MFSLVPSIFSPILAKFKAKAFNKFSTAAIFFLSFLSEWLLCVLELLGNSMSFQIHNSRAC